VGDAAETELKSANVLPAVQSKRQARDKPRLDGKTARTRESGQMNDGRQRAEPIRSSANANERLDDAPYLAYCLVVAAKQFIALVSKRWPELKGPG
jgi:hypothetical protein